MKGTTPIPKPCRSYYVIRHCPLAIINPLDSATLAHGQEEDCHSQAAPKCCRGGCDAGRARSIQGSTLVVQLCPGQDEVCQIDRNQAHHSASRHMWSKLSNAYEGMRTPRTVLICVYSVRKTVHSRCYVCLDAPAAIPAFKAAVEKHVYVTDRGAQYRGVVEFAPYQGVPEGKVKRDPREGTLHNGKAPPMRRPRKHCSLLHLRQRQHLWSCHTYRWHQFHASTCACKRKCTSSRQFAEQQSSPGLVVGPCQALT